MLFKGFSNPALNLGCVDVQLATAKKLDLMTCVTCGSATEKMLSSDCNHVYCVNCLFVPDGSSLDAQVVTAHCLPCTRTISCMKITLSEEFVAQLQCVCTQCKVIVRLDELKGHLRCCMASGAFVHFAKDKQTSAEDTNGKSESVSAITANVTESLEAFALLGEQSEDSVPTDSSLDNPTAAIVSGIRRELIDMMSKKENALLEKQNELSQELTALGARISTKQDKGPTYKLAFR